MSISIKYSGFKDRKGIPICDNDLLKILHFKRGSRSFYIYRRALKLFDKYYLVANQELGIRPLTECYKTILHKELDFSSIEVIDGDSFDHPVDKTSIYWSERKLKRNRGVFDT